MACITEYDTFKTSYIYFCLNEIRKKKLKLTFVAHTITWKIWTTPVSLYQFGDDIDCLIKSKIVYWFLILFIVLKFLSFQSEDEALAKALQLSLEDNPQAAAPASKKWVQNIVFLHLILFYPFLYIATRVKFMENFVKVMFLIYIYYKAPS